MRLVMLAWLDGNKSNYDNSGMKDIFAAALILPKVYLNKAFLDLFDIIIKAKLMDKIFCSFSLYS